MGTTVAFIVIAILVAGLFVALLALFRSRRNRRDITIHSSIQHMRYGAWGTECRTLPCVAEW